MKESLIQRQIMDFLKAQGILHWRQNLGAVMVRQNGGKLAYAKNPMKGFPDLAGLINGKLFVIEVKTEDGILSEYQRIWKGLLETNGALYCLARCIEDVEVFLAMTAQAAEPH